MKNQTQQRYQHAWTKLKQNNQNSKADAAQKKNTIGIIKYVAETIFGFLPAGGASSKMEGSKNRKIKFL